jgi:clan AA aspartic protease (TIGR02281 family)
MVDTGASVIALTVSNAARLGIHPAQRDFTVEVRTANGSVRAAPARLDKVEVGDLIVRDVAAVILADGALSDNLLGLSFLSRAAAVRVQRRPAGPRAIAPAAPVCSAQRTVNDAAWRFRITGNEKSMPLV